MNINKLNLEVAKCASTEESRYHLNGIHFTSGYTEATDGHILGRVTYPPQFPIEEVPEVIKTDDKEKIKDFIVPLKGIKDIKFHKPTTLAVLNEVYIDVEATNQNGIARFSSTNLETTPVTEIRKIDGEFPDISQVWPKDEQTVFEFSLDARLLKRIAEIVTSFGKGPVPCTLTFYDLNSPMKIQAHSGDTGQTFTGLIMPIRGEARDFSKASDPMAYLEKEHRNHGDYDECPFPKGRTAKAIWKSAHHFKRLAKRLAR